MQRRITSFHTKPKKPLKKSTFKRATKRAKINSKRVKRKKAPSIRLLKNKLWNECKRIVRERYIDQNGNWHCYTCDALLDEPKKAQTGHFIPSSICSVEMRYDLDNLRVQCYRCNINLSGNWPEYEKRLNIEKGDGFTDKLKERNESTKGLSYRSDWYEIYINNYKQI